jgi:hypothetical protein
MWSTVEAKRALALFANGITFTGLAQITSLSFEPVNVEHS